MNTKQVWTTEELDFLKENSKMPNKELAQLMNRSENSIATMKCRLKLNEKYWKYGHKSTNSERKRSFYQRHREEILAQIKSSEKYIAQRKKVKTAA